MGYRGSERRAKMAADAPRVDVTFLLEGLAKFACRLQKRVGRPVQFVDGPTSALRANVVFLPQKELSYVNKMQELLTTKRIIIALAILFVLFFAAGAVWYYFLRDDGSGNNDSAGTGSQTNPFPEGEGNLPGAGESQVGGGQDFGGASQNLNASRGDSFQIVPDAVAGAGFYNNKIRYIEKSSGNIFEVDLDGKNKTNLSNNKISGVFDAIWSKQGTRAIIKYASGDKIITMSAVITGSSTKTIILPSGTRGVAFSPKGDKIAYVLSSGNDGSVITATPENKSQVVRLKMKYSSWKILWAEDNGIYLLSSPSAYLDGFLYKITLSSGVFSKILGPYPGLLASVNNPNIIFSETNQESKSVDTLISNSSGGNIGPMPVKALPEKCVWSKKVKDIVFCASPLIMPGAIYPDDWYMGKVSFGDAVVKINIVSRAIISFLLPETIDATKLFLSDDETNLFFINKGDESLWKLRIP